MVDKLLNDYKLLIDKEIDRLFPKVCTDWYPEVIEASRYSLMLGGKRIRPIIMLEFCKLFGGDYNECINFAVALEMIHTYSLIHDDLPCMDNDDMRRGNPSCHIKFGEDIALLAGDTLLTESFKIAANAPVDNDKKIRAIHPRLIRLVRRGTLAKLIERAPANDNDHRSKNQPIAPGMNPGGMNDRYGPFF